MRMPSYVLNPYLEHLFDLGHLYVKEQKECCIQAECDNLRLWRANYLPFEPGTPSVPLTPGTPSVPLTLGTPSVPLTPGTPSVPLAPGKPSVPLTPGKPSVPSVPGSPRDVRWKDGET